MEKVRAEEEKAAKDKKTEKKGRDGKEDFLENKDIVKKCILGAALVMLVTALSVIVKLLLDGKRKKKRKR